MGLGPVNRQHVGFSVEYLEQITRSALQTRQEDKEEALKVKKMEQSMSGITVPA